MNRAFYHRKKSQSKDLDDLKKIFNAIGYMTVLFINLEIHSKLFQKQNKELKN